jgi:hypothetical protein
MNTFFIFDLQKSNNYNSVRFGMQKSANDMLVCQLNQQQYSLNHQNYSHNHQNYGHS